MNSLKTPEKNKKLCDRCTMCCEYITIIINTPQTAAEIDRIKWYLCHNVHIFITGEGLWKIDIPMKCTALNNKGECSIYNKRPQLCRDHFHESCENNETSFDNQALFTKVEELEEYLNKNKLF